MRCHPFPDLHRQRLYERQGVRTRERHLEIEPNQTGKAAPGKQNLWLSLCGEHVKCYRVYL